MDDCHKRLGSIRVHCTADTTFVREEDGVGVMRVPGYFSTDPQDVTSGQNLDLNAITHSFENQVDWFNKRGSGFTLDRITKFVVCITKYRPLHGSSYIPTPGYIARKRCVVNVENNDELCFVWALLSCLFPKETNKNVLTHYIKHKSCLNLDGLVFPLEPKSIPQFEKQNPTISVNVLSLDSDSRGFSVQYLSPERDREHHVNLLLLDDGNKRHYVWISNMSRLVAGRTNHTGATHVCNSCLHPFSTKQCLDNHLSYCLKHRPQPVRYPNANVEKESTLTFRDQKKQFKLPFYLVADFESFLVPIEDNDELFSTRLIDEHCVSGFACYRVTEHLKYQTEPTVYSGKDVMAKFYDHIIQESAEIGKIINNQLAMSALTTDQQTKFDNATICHNCNEPFTDKNYKVRHHCHISGEFLFPCCNNCNLQLKMTKCKRKKTTHNDDKKRTRTSSDTDVDSDTDDDDDFDDAQEDYDGNYLVPVITHNLRGYDGHFIIKNFDKKYVECHTKHGKPTYDDIKVIPLNSENYTTFQIGNIRFIDSYQFLSSSLENLVSLLLKSGKQNFKHTTKFLGDDDTVFSKGIYPYSYMTSEKKFAETQLPPIDAFYDTLKGEALEPADYQRAQKIWSHFQIQNMKEYHDHYLLSDVLLLADVFENFRNSVYNDHKLDCLHFVTLPSLAWSAALHHTRARLDLITDPEMYLMIENSMRGGIATISHRYASVNNPSVEGYDDTKKHDFITYLDANSLYATAQSEPLPVGDFRFLTDEEVTEFDLDSIASNSKIGYIIQCDLEYPPELHDAHNDYPMAPEHLTLTKDMLSPFSLGLLDQNHHWTPTQKLVPNLFSKTKYVTHYRNLQLYTKHGLKITKYHRILSFSQSCWLKPWIQLCNKQRREATSDFESDLAKLKANATFGKTMEQVRKRVNIRLIVDPNKLLKAVSNVTFRQSEIINKDLVIVRNARKQVTLNKPITVGFAILELSKHIMYSFYYDVLKARYGEKCKLLFTDTDSLCCHIETHDLHKDMEEHLHHFDTSNFETPLYRNENHRKLNKFKSETGSTQPKEFVGLRAKMYSLWVPTDPKKSFVKAKGIQLSLIHI